MVAKTRIFTVLVIVTNVLGNLLLKMGMERAGSLLGKPPVAYITTLFHPLVAIGVGLLIVWMVSQMTLLSWADLSYVVPVTSAGYVLSAVAGRVFLHEQISWQRWAGVWLIVFGVLLVHRTPPAAEQVTALAKTPSAEKPTGLVCP